MVLAFDAVLYAQFHSKDLIINILLAWGKSTQSLDMPIHLNRRARSTLEWLIPSWIVDARKSFQLIPWRVLMTDASLFVWRGALDKWLVQ